MSEQSSEHEAADENASASRWSVEERAWKQELPHLPDEVIALLATPVVVHAAALAKAVEPADPALEPAEVGPRFLPPVPPQSDVVSLRITRSVRPTARIA